jgi:hypothetical protein
MDEVLYEKIKEVKNMLKTSLSDMMDMINHKEEDCFTEAIKLFILLPEQLKDFNDMLERQKNIYMQLENSSETLIPQKMVDGIEAIADKFVTDSFQMGSMFILPDGKLLYMPDGHQSFFDEIKNTVPDCKAPAFTLTKLGWIRLNTQVKYINIKGITPTAIQDQFIEQAIAFMGSTVQIIQ